jgi:predicted ester cyclase
MGEWAAAFGRQEAVHSGEFMGLAPTGKAGRDPVHGFLEGRAEDDAKVRAVVEATLADIEARGDAAVRDLSAEVRQLRPRASA